MKIKLKWAMRSIGIVCLILIIGTSAFMVNWFIEVGKKYPETTMSIHDVCNKNNESELCSLPLNTFGAGLYISGIKYFLLGMGVMFILLFDWDSIEIRKRKSNG